ncbi:MAG: efflux RND transporter periplasmic adaptor subunit [Planctomycetaceae bacterium]|nr:efflux RND transporter periplasmic adaptor subunit [Planctomycetaceae bacterium]
MMKAILTLLAVGVSAGLGWGVYTYSSAAADNSVPPVAKQPISVETMISHEQFIEDRAQLVGSLEAGAEVQILAHRNGYITKLPFDVGDPIKRGDVIVTLDDREQQEMVAGAKAALVVVQAQKKAAEAKEKMASAEYRRQQRLVDRNAATQQALEEAQSQWDIAVAQRELEEAHVMQAQSEVDRTQLALEDSKILASMSGYVGERLVDVGDLAKPDVPLLRIVSFDKVRTIVHVVEKDYPRVQIGQDATIQVDAFPRQEFFGKVIRKAPVLNPNTRTAAVQIEIPNKDRRLKPGMHARVSLVFQRRNAIVLPVAALVDQNERPTVFVVENDPPTIRKQEVVTGINDGEFVEILSGLAGDDQIVTLGNHLVKNGQVVNPVEIPWPSSFDPEIQIVEESSQRSSKSSDTHATGE